MHGPRRRGVDSGVLYLRAFGGSGKRAEQADETGGHGTRGFADEQIDAVSLGEGVGVVSVFSIHAPSAGGAVEGGAVWVTAGGVAEDDGDEVLLGVTHGDEVPVCRGGVPGGSCYNP